MINLSRAIPTPYPHFIATFLREVGVSVIKQELSETIMHWCRLQVDIKHLSLLNEAKGSKAEIDLSCVAHETHMIWGNEVGRRRVFKKNSTKL